jgi:predicted phage terminase large subunit-like protein
VQATDLTIQQRIERQYTAVTAETCRRSLRKFVKAVWPLIDPKPYVQAWHIDAICDHLAYVAIGDIRNLMVNVPPRMTKSSIISVAFPAWIWTTDPDLQFLCASYSQDLAETDAAKMRRIVQSAWYQARYPGVILLADNNRIEDFRNAKGGYRQTISTEGVTTGKGGDIQILDDPHNTAVIESDKKRKSVINWHDNSWRSRVNNQNNARRIYTGQRSHDGDLFGHVLGREEKRWVVVNLPMEFDKSAPCVTYRNNGQGPTGKPIFRDPRTKANSLLCPERYNEEAVETEKEAIPVRTWNAQFQQKPEGAGGVILKRKWWQEWTWPPWHPQYRKSERELPEVISVIQAYDTAFEQSEQDSFTVRTTWGLFEHANTIRLPNGQTRQGENKINAILLERRKWRPSFGALLDDAIDSNNEWEPDRVLVEKKASGHDLIHELRKKDVPVRGIKVAVDLVYRAHASCYPLEKGSIWFLRRNWSMDLIEECAKFPNVDFNDQVSSCTIAWMYMRRYMDLQIEDDDDTEDLDLFSAAYIQQKQMKRGYYA